MADILDFDHFGLDQKILQAVKDLGFTKPTPIQVKAIPVVIQGKDVMGAAQTGTGKTAGYGLPLLQRLIPKQNSSASPARHPVRALILTPTRELAEQVAENMKQYSVHTQLRTTAAYGGVDIKPQAAAIKNGTEILICTPGRLLDHLEQKNVNLSQVEMLVLDEADRMLDMGFLPDIVRIIKQIPATSQNLMFSATFSPEIKKLASNFLKDPVLVEVARSNETAATINQKVFLVKDDSKIDALVDVLNRFAKKGSETLQVIVFVNAKIAARRLARQLESYGFNCDSIHGDKSQEERSKTLEEFKEGKTNILVATDVAARGLDIAELPVVINYDPPYSAEDYVHRIGRTGRAGASGLAITLTTQKEERLIEAIEALTKQKFKIIPLNARPAKKVPYSQRTRSGWKTALDVPSKIPPADPLFSQPYTPKPASARAEPPVDISRRKPEISVKKPLSVLLGGSGKKGS